MSLIIGAKFKDNNKERAMLVSDTGEFSSTGYSLSAPKIHESSTGLVFGIIGDCADESEFLNKTAKDLNQCNSLDDVYALFSGKFMISFKGKELETIFTHYKDSRLLFYQPPQERKDRNPELRWERTYWPIGAGDAIHTDFVKAYDNDWWVNLPTKENLIELMLDSFYKAINAKRGEIKNPLDIVCTNPYEKCKIKDHDKEWQDTVKRVTAKMKIKGVSLDNLVFNLDHEFRHYEKPPEPRKVDAVKESKSKK